MGKAREDYLYYAFNILCSFYTEIMTRVWHTKRYYNRGIMKPVRLFLC